MFTMLFVALGCASNESRTPSETVLGYFAALRAHDIDAAMDLLHEDFVFRDRTGSFAVSRSGIRPMLAWDAATDARGDMTILATAGDTVRVHQLETNDFLEILGLGPWEQRATFVVSDGAIREIILASGTELLSAVDEAIAPVVNWARGTRPGDLEGLLEDGTIVFDGESATGWLKLLGEARRAGVIGRREP